MEKAETMSMELDELDKLAASAFDGYLVRKDLVLWCRFKMHGGVKFTGTYRVGTDVDGRKNIGDPKIL